MGRSVLGVVCTVLAVAASLVSGIANVALEISVAGSDELHPTAGALLGWFLGVGAAIMLVWRHRWPLVVTGIAIVPPLLLRADSLAALIALAALATYFTGWWRWSAAALVFAATGLAVWRDVGRDAELSLSEAWISTGTTGAMLTGVVLTAAFYTAIPLTIGVVRHSITETRRRTAEQAALRDQVARREEQARIAREMHDVLGHRLSLLSLQAGALEVTSGTTPDAAAAAKTVRTTARQSLDDLRQVIGVLRGPGFADRPAGGPAQPPQPTLADIPDLVTGARQAGLAVNLTVLLDQATTAPAPLGTAATGSSRKRSPTSCGTRRARPRRSRCAAVPAPGCSSRSSTRCRRTRCPRPVRAPVSPASTNGSRSSAGRSPRARPTSGRSCCGPRSRGCRPRPSMGG